LRSRLRARTAARAEELAKEAKKHLAKEKKKEQTKLNKLKKHATSSNKIFNSKIAVKTEIPDDGSMHPGLIMEIVEAGI
jgi:hypothetical protein